MFVWSHSTKDSPVFELLLLCDAAAAGEVRTLDGEAAPL